MLEIRGLSAAIEDKQFLPPASISRCRKGEVHAVMGPNGSGKSTLAYVLSGREDYVVTDGSVSFDGRDLGFRWNRRSARRLGLFLASDLAPDLRVLESGQARRRARLGLHRKLGHGRRSTEPSVTT